MKKKIIIFDYDGTLVDTIPTVVSVLSNIREGLGKAPISTEEILSCISEGGSSLIKRALSISNEEVDFFLNVFRTSYHNNDLSLDKIYPGVINVLRYLRKKDLELWVCSNKPGKLLERGLAHHELKHFFSNVIAGDSGAYTKPNKLMLEPLLKKSTPNYQNEVLMIGDSKFDLDLAKNCNIDFYFYTGGYNDIIDWTGIASFSKYQEFDYSIIFKGDNFECT